MRLDVRYRMLHPLAHKFKPHLPKRRDEFSVSSIPGTSNRTKQDAFSSPSPSNVLEQKTPPAGLRRQRPVRHPASVGDGEGVSSDIIHG